MIFCCCSTSTICRPYLWTVKGCGGAVLSGATVSMTQGGTTVTGTTDGSGQVTINLPTSGTWGWTVGAPAGSNYAGASGTFTGVTCSATVINTTVTLGPDAGYTCNNIECTTASNASCGDTGPPPYLIRSIPATLYLTDPFGVITLTGGGGSYSGSTTRTATTADDDSGGAGAFCTEPSNVMVPVYFTLTCTGSSRGAWTLQIDYAGANCRSTQYYPGTNTSGLRASPHAVYPGPITINGRSFSSDGINSSCAPTMACSMTCNFSAFDAFHGFYVDMGAYVYGPGGAVAFSVSN